MTLKVLQEKYPYHKVKHEPQSNCEACGGTGECTNKYGTRPCICTCVDLKGIGGLFKDFVDKELKELRGL